MLECTGIEFRRDSLKRACFIKYTQVSLLELHFANRSVFVAFEIETWGILAADHENYGPLAEPHCEFPPLYIPPPPLGRKAVPSADHGDSPGYETSYLLIPFTL